MGPVGAIELGGPWRAAPADEALRRAFVLPAFDDDAWEAVPVPGHWRSVPAFAALDGPLLYRRRFSPAVTYLLTTPILIALAYLFYGALATLLPPSL